MPLIGLIGRKSSGKSTAANYMTAKWFYAQYAFADPLKRGIIEIFGIPDESVYGTEAQKNAIDPYWDVSGRQLMQYCGTELFREKLPELLPQLNDIWIRRMEKTLQQTPHSNIVISDVRFQAEADLIKRLGGILIQIERPSVIHHDNHPSETQSIQADHIITNSGNLQDFYNELDELCHAWNA